MGPKFYLQVANLLNSSLHLSKETFKLNHVRQLGVDMLVVEVVLLDILLDDVLVPENGELLLKRGLFLLCNVQLDKRSVYVLHDLEKVERERYVYAWAVDELVQRILIQTLDEVVEEYLVQVWCGLVPLAELVGSHVEQLILILAWALSILALEHVYVDDSDHGHAVGLIIVDALGEVGHVMHLDQGVDIELNLVNVGLHELLYSLFPEIFDKQTHQGYAREDDNDVTVDVKKFHKHGVH